jgi:hypothetical protein
MRREQLCIRTLWRGSSIQRGAAPADKFEFQKEQYHGCLRIHRLLVRYPDVERSNEGQCEATRKKRKQSEKEEEKQTRGVFGWWWHARRFGIGDFHTCLQLWPSDKMVRNTPFSLPIHSIGINEWNISASVSGLSLCIKASHGVQSVLLSALCTLDRFVPTSKRTRGACLLIDSLNSASREDGSLLCP